ncbi:integrase [Escherichia coli]|nr:integrase [Escherichia coli]
MGRWWRYKWITFHPSLTQTVGSIDLSMLDYYLRLPANGI